MHICWFGFALSYVHISISCRISNINISHISNIVFCNFSNIYISNISSQILIFGKCTSHIISHKHFFSRERFFFDYFDSIFNWWSKYWIRHKPFSYIIDISVYCKHDKYKSWKLQENVGFFSSQQQILPRSASTSMTPHHQVYLFWFYLIIHQQMDKFSCVVVIIFHVRIFCCF